MPWDGSGGPRETGARNVPGEHQSQRAEAANVPSEVAPCHLGVTSVLIEDTAWIFLPTDVLLLTCKQYFAHSSNSLNTFRQFKHLPSSIMIISKWQSVSPRKLVSPGLVLVSPGISPGAIVLTAFLNVECMNQWVNEHSFTPKEEPISFSFHNRPSEGSYCQPRFFNEKTEAQRWCHLPKVTHLITGRTSIWNQSCLTPSPMLFLLCHLICQIRFDLFNLHIMRPILSLFTNGKVEVSKFTHFAQVHPAAKFKSWIGTWLWLQH